MAEPVRVLHLVKGLGPGGAERLLVVDGRGGRPRRGAPTRSPTSSTGSSTWCPSSRPSGVPHPPARRAARACPTLAGRGASGRWPAASTSCTSTRRRSAPSRARSLRTCAKRRPVLVSTEHNVWASHGRLTRVANAAHAAARPACAGPCPRRWSRRRGRRWRAETEVLVHGIPLRRARRPAAASGTAPAPSTGWSDDDVVVAIVANLRANKDYPTLFAAAAEAHRRGAPAAVRVRSARVRSRTSCVRALARHGLGGALHDARLPRRPAGGARRRRRVHPQLVGTRACRSACSRPWPLGLPPVVTRVGGNAEVVTDGVDGLLVEPARSRSRWPTPTCAPARDPRRRASARWRPRPGRADDFDIAANGTASSRLATASWWDGDRRARGPPGHRRTTRTGSSRSPPARSAGRATSATGRSSAWKHEANPFGRSPSWVAVRRRPDRRLPHLPPVGARGAGRRRLRWSGPSTPPPTPTTRAGASSAGSPCTPSRSCTADGVDAVFNTPNDQSRPGYLKMGWHQLGRPTCRSCPARPAAVVRARPQPPPAGEVVRAVHDRASRRRRLGDAGRRPVRCPRRAAVRRVATPRTRRVPGLALRLRAARLPGHRGAGRRLRLPGASPGRPTGRWSSSSGCRPRPTVAPCGAARARSCGDYARRRSGWAPPPRRRCPLPRQGPIVTWRPLADEPRSRRSATSASRWATSSSSERLGPAKGPNGPWGREQDLGTLLPVHVPWRDKFGECDGGNKT